MNAQSEQHERSQQTGDLRSKQAIAQKPNEVTF
jgi:hypothetical protein